MFEDVQTGFGEQPIHIPADLEIFRKPIPVVLLVEPLGIQGAPHLQDLEVSLQFLRQLRGLHIEPAAPRGLLLLHLRRKTTSLPSAGHGSEEPGDVSRTHPALQLQRLFGLAVRRHRVLLLKVCSDYTLLHHLRTSQTKSSQPRRQRPKGTKNRGGTVNNSVCGLIGFTCPCASATVTHSALGFSVEKRKSFTVPHLGSFFPSALAASWRQLLICRHQN